MNRTKEYRIQAAELIKNQWIPDTEAMIPDVSDEKKRGGFEEELEKIKAEFAELKDADFDNEEVQEKVKNLYNRAEDLYGTVSLCFEKEEEEV
ncbi:MAG: hypothetical protein NT098_00660 [Candidatus Parcubacteria bacterium]|nr:hypothetical protein [Candidatus Parcubacteria bacterium]